jgi:hypothetical protein
MAASLRAGRLVLDYITNFELVRHELHPFYAAVRPSGYLTYM